MIREEIIRRMDLAVKQDRDRFFKVADAMTFQPKYVDKADEIEELKQQWRDITELENYPEIEFPLALPDWFPKVNFYSRWDENYVRERIDND